MILFESIIDGIRDIKDHFGRTMLQLLGVILGAGSIVATFSLSVTGKQQAMEYYKVSGGIQKIWVSNKPTGKVTLNAKALASQGLTVHDALAIQRDAKQIDLVSPVSSETMTVRYRSVEKPRSVMGVAPIALRVPTSRTRSLNDASWMFITTMPPTISEISPQIMKVMSYILFCCSLRRRLATREKTS